MNALLSEDNLQFSLLIFALPVFFWTDAALGTVVSRNRDCCHIAINAFIYLLRAS